MDSPRRKVAINPLPWVFSNGMSFDLSEPTLRQAMTELRPLGYSAMHSDVPETMSAEQYRALLAEYDFTPAPGYFAADFQTTSKMPVILEAAKAHAATIAALGVDTTFVAGNIELPRVMNPTWGENSSYERTQRTAENLAAAAEVGLAEGVRFALHPHAAMSIETEEETRGILDATAGSALAFGPDTGHLLWLGMAPERIIADYADRVAAVHLKDIDLAALKTVTRYGDDFLTATKVRRLWRELGEGAVNFAGVLNALPDTFDGWFVVEVDVPSIPDRVESSRISHDYLNSLPYFQAVNA